MGLSLDTVCRTCKRVAPWLGGGDGGFHGILDLSDEMKQPAMGRQSLGYVYSVFEAVGVVTYEWYSFREFVAEHVGHELLTMTDQVELESDNEYRDPDDEPGLDEIPEGWIYARLEVLCHACGESHLTEEADLLRAELELTIDAHDIDALEGLIPGLPDNLYRCEPLGDLEAFAAFLAIHREHYLTVSAIPEQKDDERVG